MPSPSDPTFAAADRPAGSRSRVGPTRHGVQLGTLLAGWLLSCAIVPAAAAAEAAPIALAALAPEAVATLGVRFREVDQREYRGCMLNFRALVKNPPDFPDGSLIVDGNLAYALPANDEPPRIGLSVIFSKENKRSMAPLPGVEIAYLQTSNGSTGNSIAERVPGTPAPVASFAFGVDPSSGQVIRDLRNGKSFELMYRLAPGNEIRSVPIDTSIADSTFSDGKLIRYPSPQAMRNFAQCVDKLTVAAMRIDQHAAAGAHVAHEDASTSGAFVRWLKQYSPFPLARAADAR